MSRSLKRFGAYLAGNLVQKLGQFLLLPLLAPIATGAEFSRFGLFASVVTLAAVVGSLNVHQSIGRTYFDVEDPERRATVLTSSLAFGLLFAATGLAVAAAALLLSGFIDPLTLGQPQVLAMVALAVLALVTNQFGSVLFRVIDRPVAFATLSAVQGGLLPVAFLALHAMGTSPLWSAFGAYGLAQGLTAATGLVMGWDSLRGGLVKLWPLHRALDYSVGTTVHQLVTWIVIQSGRWIGALAVPLSLMGGYTLFSFILMATTMLSATTYEARRVEVLRAFAKGDTRAGLSDLRKLLWMNYALSGLIFVGALAAYQLQGFVLKPEMRLSLGLVLLWLPLNLLQVLHNNNYWIAVGLHRTRRFALWELPGAAVGMGASIVLVRLIGVEGLVLGAVIGTGIQAAMSTYQVRRILNE